VLRQKSLPRINEDDGGSTNEANVADSGLATLRDVTSDNALSHVSQVCYASRMEMKSKREAAQMLGVSTRAIERAVRRGQLAVQYRDSKHGKKAWFRPADLHGYRRHQEERSPMGFTPLTPKQVLPPNPTVGALVPMVEIESWPKKGKHKPSDNPVPIADRLTLRLNEAVQLSGLPHTYILENIRSGKLKAIRIGRAWHIKRSDLSDFVQSL
jgi:excisionase family DNA binding protein